MAYSIATNKRRFPRAPLQASAELTHKGRQLKATVRQIGEGGLCFVCAQELDGNVAVEFELPGFGRQQMFSEVRWVVKPGESRRADGGYACGCRFTRIDQMSQAQIARYVSKVKLTYSQLQFALALGKPRAELLPLLREVGLHNLIDRQELKKAVADVIAQLQPVVPH
jgi:hypothetical protein